METIILQHKITYSWKDGSDRGLSDSDVEHIHYMINHDYSEGELCSFDPETEEDSYGYWSIK